jgi:hypothetical protein
MTDTTFSRRLLQLINEVKNHPDRDEIIKLAKEQLIDEAEFTIIARN